MKKEWQKAIKRERSKNIKIEVKYSENSQRPNKFDVSCEINGRAFVFNRKYLGVRKSETIAHI